MANSKDKNHKKKDRLEKDALTHKQKQPLGRLIDDTEDRKLRDVIVLVGAGASAAAPPSTAFRRR